MSGTADIPGTLDIIKAADGVAGPATQIKLQDGTILNINCIEDLEILGRIGDEVKGVLRSSLGAGGAAGVSLGKPVLLADGVATEFDTIQAAIDAVPFETALSPADFGDVIQEMRKRPTIFIPGGREYFENLVVEGNTIGGFNFKAVSLVGIGPVASLPAASLPFNFIFGHNPIIVGDNVTDTIRVGDLAMLSLSSIASTQRPVQQSLSAGGIFSLNFDGALAVAAYNCFFGNAHFPISTGDPADNLDFHGMPAIKARIKPTSLGIVGVLTLARCRVQATDVEAVIDATVQTGVNSQTGIYLSETSVRATTGKGVPTGVVKCIKIVADELSLPAGGVDILEGRMTIELASTAKLVVADTSLAPGATTITLTTPDFSAVTEGRLYQAQTIDPLTLGPGGAIELLTKDDGGGGGPFIITTSPTDTSLHTGDLLAPLDADVKKAIVVNGSGLFRFARVEVQDGASGIDATSSTVETIDLQSS